MHYQKIGQVIIINKNDKKLAERLLKKIPDTKTVMYKSGWIEGQFRQPKLKKLVGNGTETIHKEHGCLFKLDVSKIMWSKGNHLERLRITKLVKPGEIIVDMFAGIGYFSVPLAVHTKAKRIYSIEINPVAYGYLRENIELNKIKNIEPILGDCLNVDIDEKADRVLMGLLPSSKNYLLKAIDFVRSGGIIHYHGIDEEEPKSLERDVKKVCENCKILQRVKIKSWGPRRYHWVLDVKV
ncbi:MAG: class I SAM-dependent methyltransferase family protein [Candidatus Aenigmarchaeota archaeon]|nr:class I SAM-dependent methyltransferase family protein [Candidatus Aenigmarchaeota archaeon]